MLHRFSLSLALAMAASTACNGNASTGGSGGAGASGGAGGAGGVPPCALPYLGDPSLPIELELTSLGPDYASSPLSDGGPIALMLPPQGGRVVFVGVRATNISPCGAQLTGSVRDTTTGQIRLDGRTINLEPIGDGWGRSVDSNQGTFANVPLCPNQWASTDAYGHPFELTVTLVEPGGRTAEQVVSVVPECSEPEFEAECLCQCKQGYMLGEPCP